MVLVTLAVGAEAARADEFRVGVVAGPDRDRFVAGFRVAVDESPDVGHPPGVEGGDHLGGMDVMVAVASDGDEVASTPIVVGPDPDLLAPLAGTGPALLAVTRQPRPTDGVFTVTADEVHHLLSDRTPELATRLQSGGGPVDDVVVAGYLAGRLVDLAVSATARDPSDTDKVRAAWEAAVHRATASPSVPVDQPGDSRAGVLAALAGSAAILAATFLAVRRRARDPRP